MTMNLDKDYSINGHEFKAGDKVETKVTDVNADGKATQVDYESGLKELIKSTAEATTTEPTKESTKENK